MHLVVKQNNAGVRELEFIEGPVSIGRAADSQVFLPDKTVSRKHAVIHNTPDGKWIIEGLASAGKTYLNDEAVHKAQIKTGDRVRITDFTIEFNIETDAVATAEPLPAAEPVPTTEPLPAAETAPLAEPEKPVEPKEEFHLQAALATPPHETVVRQPDSSHAPAMRLAAGRLTDFSKATEVICEAGSLDELLLALLDITLEQFGAFHTWCALRTAPGGPMICHAGKKRDGNTIELDEIILRGKITQVVEKGQFLVLPRVSAQIEEDEALRSALIAAIMRPDGCYGVLYVDNAMKDKHYSLSDLDYLMLVTMHTAAVMKKFMDS